jgi:hypothetical protein
MVYLFGLFGLLFCLCGHVSFFGPFRLCGHVLDLFFLCGHVSFFGHLYLCGLFLGVHLSTFWLCHKRISRISCTF